MEILSGQVLKGEYYFILTVLSLIGLLFLIMSVGILISMISDKDFTFNNVAGTIVCGVVALLVSFGLYTAYQKGAEVQYKATVTDFNEVYDQGYEIIGNEGKIYTLKKKE